MLVLDDNTSLDKESPSYLKQELSLKVLDISQIGNFGCFWSLDWSQGSEKV